MSINYLKHSKPWRYEKPSTTLRKERIIQMAQLKKGDRPILTELERSGVGLRFNIKCHPIIEEFMRNSLGTDPPTINPVADFARIWEPAKGESKKELLVYGIPKELNGVFQVGPSMSYRLDRPGQPIFVNGDGLDSRGNARTLNLSFLRLVGISEGDGVTFHIGGIFSDTVIDELERALDLATSEIYKQFMKPIKITVELVVRDSGVERTLVSEVEAPDEGVDTAIVQNGVAS